MNKPTPQRIRELRTMPYEDYLKTLEWQEKRDQALERDGYRCRNCNSNEKLHVHHRTYIRRGNEEINDLTTLCNDCHEHFHSRMRRQDDMGSPDDVMISEKEEQERKSKGNTYKLERYLIGLLIQNPEICPHVAGILAVEDFVDPDIQELYRIYLSVCQRIPPVSQPFEQIIPSELLPTMTKAIESIDEASLLLDKARQINAAIQCSVRLKRARLQEKIKELQPLIREAANSGDRELERQLREQGFVYQKLLRTLSIPTSL